MVMDTTTTPPPRLSMDSFGVLGSRLWQRYNQHFPVLVWIALVANAAVIITNFFSTDSLHRWGNDLAAGRISGSALAAFLLLAVVVIGLSVWGSVAMTFAIAKPAEATSWQMAFRRGGSYVWPSFTTGLLLFIVLFGWTLLLVIPGIYFAGLYSLSGYLVIREEKKNMAALGRSAELIRGYWWAVFWRQVIFALVYGFGLSIISSSLAGLASHFGQTGSLMVSGVLTSLLGILALPIWSLLPAVIYDNLVALHSDRPVPAQ